MTWKRRRRRRPNSNFICRKETFPKTTSPSACRISILVTLNVENLLPGRAGARKNPPEQVELHFISG
jgi:hypothetical protein